MLKYELDPAMSRLPRDVGEVVAYLRAMNHGLERPTMPPMTLGLIREIHAELKRVTWRLEREGWVVERSGTTSECCG